MSDRMRDSRRFRPEAPPLEERALMAVAGGALGSQLGSLRLSLPQLIGRLPGGLKLPPIAVDSSGVSAIKAALTGSGPGSEFAKLLTSKVGNLTSVINGFVRGSRTEYSVPGVAIKIPKWQAAYQGPHYDHLTATAAGAILMRDGNLQLGVISRGPFDELPPSYVVFGLDRGAGAATGALFAERPGITPDLLVTIEVGPQGKSASGTITDRVTGSVVAIDPGRIRVTGAVVQVFVPISALPGQGRAPSAYRFTAWTSTDPQAGIAAVGSFVPESTMIPIGVEAAPRPPRWRR